jgi:hypothetical protein
MVCFFDDKGIAHLPISNNIKRQMVAQGRELESYLSAAHPFMSSCHVICHAGNPITKPHFIQPFVHNAPPSSFQMDRLNSAK